MKTRACIGVSFLTLVAGTSVSLGGSLPNSAIALTGTDAASGPGMGPGVTFTSIGQQQPTINSLGAVAFRGIASNDVANQGMWTFTGGANSNVAIGGGAMPGGGTYTSGTSVINSTVMAESGQWAFRLGASTGLFATVTGTPTRAAFTGDVAPGTGGATFGTMLSSGPRFSATGQIAFLANLATGTGTPPVVITGANANSQGLWTGSPASPTLTLRRDDALLSLDAGGAVRVNTMNNLSLTVNDGGRYLVSTSLQGTVTTGTGIGSNSAAILSNRSGSLEVIARVGNAAPDSTGAPSTDLYRAVPTGTMGFNNAGRVGFATTLRDAAGVQTSTGALFTDTVGGSLRMQARAGGALPTIYSPGGAPLSEFSGVTWGSAYNNLSINANDTTVFHASSLGNTGGTTNTGAILTMNSSGTFTKVVRAGDVAIVNGAPFGGDALFQNNFNSITINSEGQIAFQALLSGAGVVGGAGGNNSGLFGWDPTGGLCLIARTASPFEVSPGVFRTVSSIGGIISSGGEDGLGRSLNDNGTLVFALDFTDGSSGIFTATIPAPGTIGLLGLAGLIASRRRRA